MEEDNHPDIFPHSGMVCVVGRTNSGKSTLINKIVGEKISIVSPVVQTTRNLIRGILTDERGQLTLIDTPGLHRSRSPLGTAMNKSARRAANGADVLLVVFDGSKKPQIEDEGWMRKLAAGHDAEKVFFLLNKSDAGSLSQDFHDLWDRILKEIQQSGAAVHTTPRWFTASAATGEGVEELVNALFEQLPPGPLLFDSETISDYPRNLAIADAIREEYFKILKDEIPHSIGICVEHVSEKKTGGHTLWDIESTVYVKRETHKAIVIGRKGKNVRLVKERASKTISDDYGVTASVDIRFKTLPDWDSNPFIIRKMGVI